MKKLYGSLIVAILCSAISGLIASEKQFFDKKTKELIKKQLKSYAYGYAGLYGVGTIVATVIEVSNNRRIPNKGCNRGSWFLRHREPFRLLGSITRSIPITLPGVICVTLAYHKLVKSN
jgi:hypothetical protein